MLNFFKKKNKQSFKSDYLTRVASLLIHAARIDQSYTENEKEIIKKTLIELGADISGLDELINTASVNESDSNQYHII